MFFRDKLKLTKLPVSRILPNPSQPRKVFRQEELEALAQSIKENGLLQPVTVRRENGAYYLIAGERRLRACKLAGLREIPVLIADCEPEDSAVLALLENLQRKDLQMFEQANAIVNLLREWQITQEEAKEMMDTQEVIILDVREQDEYDSGHIPGAVLLPVGTIDETTAAEVIPEKDSTVLVYCRSGNRSKTASSTLAELGYTNIYEFGGINTWPYETES